MTPAQCRDARSFIGMSVYALSIGAAVPRAVIEDFEASLSTPSEDDLGSRPKQGWFDSMAWST